MLREHFRCVEPIIRFSFQFYDEELLPLRIPKASERLDPPLIDVYVPHGRKNRRQINIAEAEAIVDEIEKLVKDPAYENRRIGVVSLIGAKQAQYVQSSLLARIGEEAFLRHEIACGDSATFQGKERDIMFVSMVECPETRSAKTSLLFQQRFNVALSRARDRMYLFRSVEEEMLKADDLKAKVIRHFKAPMTMTNSGAKELIELCDSDFERDVFSRLVKLGYRVTPQVRVGPYSIDMVVEGDKDRRLAIELDGDRYHTPDRWAEDFKRQRILERVGWRFWRCWGSSFILDPDGCIENLLSTIHSMGILPMEGEISSTVYTEHRIISSATPEEHEHLDLIRAASEPSIEQISLSFGRQKEVETEGEKFPVEAKLPSSKPAEIQEDSFVEIGDKVLISYNNEPTLQHTIRISATEHDPDLKIIRADMPIAKALIDAEINEEVEIRAGGKVRIVTIIGIEKSERAPRNKIVRYQNQRQDHQSSETLSGSERIANIPFESHLEIRLRHIYGVLYFMEQGFDFPSATHQTLKLFPEVQDYQTISDKCARGFAGNVDTFISWFKSGQMLNKLQSEFSLSDHDYQVFKKLLV